MARPGAYLGHAREALSAVVTAGLWPLGIAHEGLPSADSAPDQGNSTPVLLVHGFGANRSNWLFLQRHLRNAGFSRLHALNYNALSCDLPHLAEAVATRAEELRQHWGTDRVHVVGHSLGGVLARYAVQVLGASGIDRCVTIASPHGGVRVAGLHDVLSGVGAFTTGHQLHPNSPFMVLLRRSARPMATQFVSYYSNLDLVVPARRAQILEPELNASNRLVHDHGHFSILLSGALGASVADELTAAERGAAGLAAPMAMPTGAGLAVPGSPTGLAPESVRLSPVS
jgi:triacylglycerol lipase